MSKVSWPPRDFKLPDDKETRSHVFHELLKAYTGLLPTSMATGAATRIKLSRWRERYKDAHSD